MKLSIVVPAYNEEKLIKRCLQSLTNQKTTQTYEILVINNNSTDGTVKIATKLASKVITEPRKGRLFAVQTGLLKAKGEYVAFIDADSVATPDWVNNIINTFTRHPQAVAVTGPYVLEEPTHFQKFYNTVSLKLVYLIFKVFHKLVYLAGGNFAAQRKTMLAFGGFDVALGVGADEYGILDKLQRQGPLIFNPDIKILTSSRRGGQGKRQFVYQLLVSYFINYFTSKHFGKRFFPEYSDYR